MLYLREKFLLKSGFKPGLQLCVLVYFNFCHPDELLALPEIPSYVIPQNFQTDSSGSISMTHRRNLLMK